MEARITEMAEEYRRVLLFMKRLDDDALLSLRHVSDD
jgi:hypothetical protein